MKYRCRNAESGGNDILQIGVLGLPASVAQVLQIVFIHSGDGSL